MYSAINSYGSLNKVTPKLFIVDRSQYYQYRQIILKLYKRKQQMQTSFPKEVDNNSNFDKMNEAQSQQMVKIQPSNVIVFYRNEFQSASSIKITKNHGLNKPIRFKLKTTNKQAYFVSESSGELAINQVYRYINILINQQVSLQQCLHDRFKLIIDIPGSPPIEKKFKVIIDYKKEILKGIPKDLQRLEVVSKTSGGNNTNPSMLGHPITTVKKSMLKKSQLVSCLGTGNESDRAKVKQQLDQVVKKVQDKKLRLSHLQKQVKKNKSRQRFMLYLALISVLMSFCLGLFLKKIFFLHYNTYAEDEEN